MSVDRRRPKTYRKSPIVEYRCQFCGRASLVQRWKDKDDHCPLCGKKFDPQLMPELRDLPTTP